VDDPEVTAERASRGTGLVESATRAVRILGMLVRNPPGLRLTEISDALGLHKATTRRLLRTLMAERIVEQDSPGAPYRFSPLVWLEIAPFLEGVRLLTTEARRILRAISRATGGTAALLFPEQSGLQMRAAMYELPDTPIRLDPAGFDERPPMHATAGGKCYLAYRTDAEVTAYIEHGLSAETENTITSPERLQKELETTRAQGFALNRQEAFPGCFTVAVPQHDAGGNVVGALATVTVGRELTPGNVREWVPLLKGAARKLSHLLRVVEGEAGGAQSVIGASATADPLADDG
jgi:IclR family acetate operon transcriptional repressor